MLCILILEPSKTVYIVIGLSYVLSILRSSNYNLLIFTKINGNQWPKLILRRLMVNYYLKLTCVFENTLSVVTQVLNVVHGSLCWKERGQNAWSLNLRCSPLPAPQPVSISFRACNLSCLTFLLKSEFVRLRLADVSFQTGKPAD